MILSGQSFKRKLKILEEKNTLLLLVMIKIIYHIGKNQVIKVMLKVKGLIVN